MSPNDLQEHLRALQAAGVKDLPMTDGELALLKKALGSASSSAPAKPAARSVPAPRPASQQTPASSPDVQSPARPSPMPRASVSISSIPALELPAGDKKTRWEWLRQRVVTDPEVLSHIRPGVQPVFGVGNINSPIFFCGEAPGAEEEQQGEPFVGRAGQLLTKIIQAMGFERSDVYIGNILNWRPEKDDMTAGNRPPTIAEMSKCLPFLKAQVRVVAPKVIVALGATATTGLLGEDPDRRMGDVRGKFFDFDGTPVMVTYHPSYLLRNNTNAAKRIVWEDMLAVMKRVGLPISPAQEKYFL